ncbi:MAG: hypothetical protein ACI38Z_04630 [Parafannyhessea sp.]|uniref:hypothetical protein n=1 Tax=Parafannyhessea sp. TaxID=2847324 RepID=UPI003F0914CA
MESLHVVARERGHELVCDGWDYYDRPVRPGRGGRGRLRLVGTFETDAEAAEAWLGMVRR